MVELIFTLVWLIILFIFFFYIATNLYFRWFSYKRDHKYFAGNKEVEQIDQNLRYYIVVPCFNEEAVIKKTLVNLLKFRKFQVVVVDDDSSDKSIEQIKTIKNNRLHLLERKAPEAHTGKGDVLNFALDYIRTDAKKKGYSDNDVIIGVIDADAELADNALEKLDNHFSTPNSNVAQMRVKMYPHFKNGVQVLQDIEFFSINHMSQLMRMYIRTVGLSGNGQFFRLKPILEKIGDHPWGNALLDDYELTIKMMVRGILVDYMTDTYVYQESLSSLKLLIRQRSRWAQGSLDCLKYFKQIVKTKDISVGQKIGIYYFLAQPWLSMTADITIIYLTVVTIARFTAIYHNVGLQATVGIVISLIIISLFIGTIFTLLYCHDLRSFHETLPKFRFLIVLPASISYAYLWLFFSLLIAYWRWIRHNNSWLKTQHGSN